MKVCYLYYKERLSDKFDEVLDAFDEHVIVDILHVNYDLEDANVYIFETTKISRHLSLKIKELLKGKKQSLIYFFINSDYTPSLVKLAFFLKIKDILIHTQDNKSIISKIKSEFKEKEEKNFHSLIGKSVFENLPIVIAKNNELFFVSKELYKEFGLNSIDEVKSRLLVQIDLKQDDNTVTNSFKKDLLYKVKAIPFLDKKLLIFESFDKNINLINKFDFVSSRIAFFEEIDKNIASKSDFFIFAIRIKNYKRLKEELSKATMKLFMREFLLMVDEALDTKTILTQYENSFYVSIFKNLDMQEMKNIADDFSKNIAEFSKRQTFTPFIDIYIFDTKELKYTEIVTTLEHICLDALSEEELRSDAILHVKNSYISYDTADEINYLLTNVFTKNLELKLVNFYKGLLVSTTSKIIKIKEDIVYVKAEHIQGFVMNRYGTTVIKSASFPSDIEANVRYVDIPKKIAILEDFKFVKGNVDAREHNRVSFPSRTPVSISQKYRGTVNGEIIDISVSGIAIRAKYTKMVNNIRSGIVQVSFILPMPSENEDFTKIVLDATVLYVHGEENDTMCKIVCKIKREEKTEAILAKYIYDRQKEIILELKKMVRNLH